ncbi:MAG: GGDEF domain-containing protein [Thermodesulfobacteriota bacterium]
MLTKQNETVNILKKPPLHMAQSVLDSLPEHIAVLDEKGVIIAANKAWINFQSENRRRSLDRATVGENYLRAFKEAYGADKKFTRAIQAISSLLMGDREKFWIEYQCRAGGQKIWFRLSVTPLKTEGVIKGAVVIHTDVTRRKTAEIETKRLAVTDPMTGVLNRRAGLDFIHKQIKLSRRHKRSLVVCYIDLDNLKYVNDNYGHKEGDKIIRAAVNIIRRVLRESDALCRLGGDEILMVLLDTTIDECTLVIDRVKDLVERKNKKLLKDWKLEFSYGLAEYTPGVKHSASELVDIADSNMYKMKTTKKQKKNINLGTTGPHWSRLSYPSRNS